ncbi:MAG: mannosyltransferase [Holophagaceae bacterium]|nr:mannosyltransferase [Holophagaceae bacterium]
MESAEFLRLSIVVPVYQGEQTLRELLDEVVPITTPQRTPGGRWFKVTEVILVHDGALDDSASVMQDLAAKHTFVTTVWLSRNFGQHPATLAGMASTTGDWVATLDEDGQHDPSDLGAMLDLAEGGGAQLVYARPVNAPPHAWWRNFTSRMVSGLGRLLVGDRSIEGFSSFRLIRGEIARSLAAYCGQGVFLDVALSWVVGRVAYSPVTLRMERGRPSGYSLGRLISHFWRLILTAGTRPLRIIAILGSLAIMASVGISAYLIWAKVAHQVPIQGWTSLITAVCLFSGLILFALGVIAEYLAMTLTMAMGRPLYLIVSRPDPGKALRP